MSGILRGFDAIFNLVLENATEYLKEFEWECDKMRENTRELGIVVCQGTRVIVISPKNGYEPIQNPFVRSPKDVEC